VASSVGAAEADDWTEIVLLVGVDTGRNPATTLAKTKIEIKRMENFILHGQSLQYYYLIGRMNKSSTDKTNEHLGWRPISLIIHPYCILSVDGGA